MRTPVVSVVMAVYNGMPWLPQTLASLRSQTFDDFEVVLIDDGSTDRTPMLLSKHPVEVIRHATNRGYGRSMMDMFRWAAVDGFDWLVTMDCDEQHEPAALGCIGRRQAVLA